jgi:ribosomal protein S17E
MAAEDTLPNEVVAKTTDELAKSDQIRKAIADTYTFVRSREINNTIAGFTLDHYIDEAKRLIKGDDRQLRDASGQDSLAVGTRPTQLESLASIQQAFNDAFEDAKKLAEKADKKGEAT